jgi:hypothetical protein
MHSSVRSLTWPSGRRFDPSTTRWSPVPTGQSLEFVASRGQNTVQKSTISADDSGDCLCQISSKNLCQIIPKVTPCEPESARAKAENGNSFGKRGRLIGSNCSLPCVALDGSPRILGQTFVPEPSRSPDDMHDADNLNPGYFRESGERDIQDLAAPIYSKVDQDLVLHGPTRTEYQLLGIPLFV